MYLWQTLLGFACKYKDLVLVEVSSFALQDKEGEQP